MRILYSGGTFCNLETFKRLLLLADEIAFMDRPSITFGTHGTVGYASEFRKFNTTEAPIKFSVHAPPSGPVNNLYARYLEADLENPQFVRTVIDGLKVDSTFQNRLIQLNGNYGWGTGQQILNALLQDTSLYDAKFPITADPRLLYVPDSSEGRKHTLAALLTEASIHVSNAMVTAEESQLRPVSDDPYFCNLLALRSSQFSYVHQQAPLASILGLAVAEAVIPDEALSTLTFKDLFEFRRSAKDSYEAWSIEVDRISLRLLDVPPERVNAEAAKIIISEIRPRVLQLRNDMTSARDKMFGDLLKKVAKWEMPTLSIAYLASLSLPVALAAFASSLTPVVPDIVDYFVKRREIGRQNSLAYLVGISKLID